MTLAHVESRAADEIGSVSPETSTRGVVTVSSPNKYLSHTLACVHGRRLCYTTTTNHVCRVCLERARLYVTHTSTTTSEQARSPAEFKHIIKRRKRN